MKLWAVQLRFCEGDTTEAAILRRRACPGLGVLQRWAWLMKCEKPELERKDHAMSAVWCNIPKMADCPRPLAFCCREGNDREHRRTPSATKHAAQVTHSAICDDYWVEFGLWFCPPQPPNPPTPWVLPSLPSHHAKRNEAVTEPGGTDGAYL